MQQAADEATEVTRLGTDGLKVSKQQPPGMMAKGTPPLKQIPGYTLWPVRSPSVLSENWCRQPLSVSRLNQL